MAFLINSIKVFVIGLAIVACLWLITPLMRDFDLVFVDAKQVSQSSSEAALELDAIMLAHLERISSDARIQDAFKRTHKTVHTPSLWMDKCQVSVSDFKNFLEFANETSQVSIDDDEPIVYRSDTIEHRVSGADKAPISGVSLDDAKGYCRYIGARLPSPDEFSIAASSGSGFLYPWGNRFKYDAWPYQNPLLNAAQPCGIHPESQSKDGIHDLASGVAEWTADENEHAISGGDGYNRPFPIHALSFFKQKASAQTRSAIVGFRCVYDRKPQTLWQWQKKPNVSHIKAGFYPVGVPAQASLATLIAHLDSDSIRTIGSSVSRSNDKAQRDWYVSRSEASVAQFQRFLRDPLVRLNFYAHTNQPSEHSYTPFDWDTQLKEKNKPVVGVDWWSAYAFAKWRGGRLPSSDEWIDSAVGSDKVPYPWGDTYLEGYANDGKQKNLAPVSADKGERSLQGLLHLGANVSEWTADQVLNAQGRAMIVVAGGNFKLPSEATQSGSTYLVGASSRFETLGMRVFYDRHPLSIPSWIKALFSSDDHQKQDEKSG